MSSKFKSWLFCPVTRDAYSSVMRFIECPFYDPWWQLHPWLCLLGPISPHDAYYIHDANYFVHLLEAMMLIRAMMLIISSLFFSAVMLITSIACIKDPRVLLSITTRKIFEKYSPFDGFKHDFMILPLLWNLKCPFEEEILGKWEK